MGLKDLLKKKLSNTEDMMDIPEVQEDKKIYTWSWLSKISLYLNIDPSSDNAKVDEILNELNNNGGYCPLTGGNNPDNRCPCTMMREDGICKHGLFKSLPSRKFKGSTSSVKIERNID